MGSICLLYAHQDYFFSLFTGRYEAVEETEVQSAADQGAISEL